MIRDEDARALILDLFEEEALVLGGLVAVHHVEDDLVWRLVRSLDAIRAKALRRIEDDISLSGEAPPDATAGDLRPHPAIEEFLRKLGRT